MKTPRMRRVAFPAILYFGGLDAEIDSNVILAEYLASHGYIVASVSLLGPTDGTDFPIADTQ